MSIKNKLVLVRAFYTMLLFVVSFQAISAQIAAPSLYCIKNDTLLWTTPTVSCGPITAYDIYFSPTKQGPYSLLIQVNDPNQTSYYHSNSGQNFYYYMTTLANCPGEISLNSDTLDNFDPPIIKIESVDVSNGKCMLTWKTPITTKSLSYIIYRSTPAGTIPVDTVFNTNSYLDLGSHPELQSEVYYILSLDPCGNASIYEKPHFSIYSEYTIDSCKQELNLKWTEYKNWEFGVKEYQVWAGINGAVPTVIDTVSGTTTQYTLKNLNDGDQLCIYVKAIQDVNGIIARSNEHCFTVKIVQPTKWLQSYSASVLPDSSIEIKWSWNKDAELLDANLFSSTQVKAITDPINYIFSMPLQQLNSFTISGKNVNQVSNYFKLSTTDQCNITKYSAPVSTILLSGKANMDKTNALTWVFPETGGAEIISYEVFKNIKGVESSGGKITKDKNSFIDLVNIDDPAQENICYYVIANIQIKQGDSSIIVDKIRSNEVCVQQFATLFFPNALVPDGFNNEFKPLSVFAQDAQYTMYIFDKWGQKVFETNDINEAWRGKKGNQALPGGVYVYYAKLVQPNGHIEERKGEVMLLR